jgi:hypothetical protein
VTPVCYLDLDGALVNFVGGAFRVHGRSIPMNTVEWDFCSQLGFNGVSDPAFWGPMGFDFWADLEWMPDGHDILEAVEDTFGPENVVLLTSPCTTRGGVEGKVEWVRRNLPEYGRRFFVGPPKHLVAGPSKVLVDDHDGNLLKFLDHRGRVVCVPRPWNILRHLTDGRGCSDLIDFRLKLNEQFLEAAK